MKCKILFLLLSIGRCLQGAEKSEFPICKQFIKDQHASCKSTAAEIHHGLTAIKNAKKKAALGVILTALLSLGTGIGAHLLSKKIKRTPKTSSIIRLLRIGRGLAIAISSLAGFAVILYLRRIYLAFKPINKAERNIKKLDAEIEGLKSSGTNEKADPAASEA